MAGRGHTKADQVLGCLFRQNVSVDEIVAERRAVLLKTELLNPTAGQNRWTRLSPDIGSVASWWPC